VLTPAQALVVVKEAITIAPEITVAGIAGPGDTLATDAALDTFALIKEEFPQLLRCMSTNGLLLTKKLQRVREVGVDTLTVTVNEINPKRLALINDHIIYQGRIYFGLAAAQMLIRKQLEGISEATRAGIMIKVNTVLIPGINEQHIGDIACTVKRAGAGLYNVIPLIANAKMANHPTPGCDMVERARADAERHITVFRNCAHCRADAIGVPGGRDYTSEIYAGCDASGTLALSCEENTFSHG
jgi:nitrogen fixation protein NifB